MRKQILYTNKMKLKEIVLIITVIILIGIIAIAFLMRRNQSEEINEEDIYPKGNLINTKFIDVSQNELPISVTQNEIDTDYIIQIIKNSDKELVHEYEEGMVQINLSFSDSTIQLLRKDTNTIYYVFHNKTYNGVCY